MDASWGSSYALFLVSALLLISLQYLLSQYVLKRGRPPGPRPLPIIGHLHLLQSPIHQSLTRLSNLHGPDLLLRFGSRPVLVLSSPSLVKECFTTHDLSFSDRPIFLSSKHFGYNATSFGLAPYGDLWRNLRRLAAFQLFSNSRLSALARLRIAEIHLLLRNLFSRSSSSPKDAGGFLPVNFRTEVGVLMLNTIMEMILGKKYFEESSPEGQRFWCITQEVFRLSGAGNLEDFLPFMKWLGVNGIEKGMITLQKEVDVFLQGIVDEKRRETMEEAGKNTNAKAGNDAKNKTLVEVMIAMQQEDPKFYTDDIIKGMIEMLVMAGVDTSTATLEWGMSLLLNHPEALKRVYDEIETQVGHQRLVTDADLPNLRYLNNVIKETLRLFPPGPLLVPRQSLTDLKVGSFNISRGTVLLVNAYKMHRDPKLWTDAAKFAPERFDNGEGGGYKYIPFGAGRRRCPGDTVAMKSVGLTLASLIQCFEWKRIGEEAVDLTEREGLSMPKAIPLEALCKPRQAMINVLSQL